MLTCTFSKTVVVDRFTNLGVTCCIHYFPMLVWCTSHTAHNLFNYEGLIGSYSVILLTLQVRTTVSRLSISPQWKHYGLRIFGYIHPSVTGMSRFIIIIIVVVVVNIKHNCQLVLFNCIISNIFYIL